MTEPDDVSPDRRSVLRAGAWAVPAVALSTAAPAYANSGTSIYVVDLATGTTATDSITYLARSVGQPDVSLTITTAPSALTTTSQRADYWNADSAVTSGNLKPASAAGYWRGGVYSGMDDTFQVLSAQAYFPAANADALILNQRRTTFLEAAAQFQTARQVLTFSFVRSDQAQTVTDLTVETYNISSFVSGGDASWRQWFWDAVAFNAPATTSLIWPPGVTSEPVHGTLISRNLPGDPDGFTTHFSRWGDASENYNPEGYAPRDRFVLSSAPVGTQMLFTQCEAYSPFMPRQGWQFIALNAISFALPTI